MNFLNGGKHMRNRSTQPSFHNIKRPENHAAEFAGLINKACKKAADKGLSVFEIPHMIYSEKKELLPDYLYKFFFFFLNRRRALKSQCVLFSDAGCFHDA